MLLETPGETERSEELRQFQRVIYGSYFVLPDPCNLFSYVHFLFQSFYASAEELIACGGNQTEKELNSREEIWIRVAEFIGIPALVRDGSAPVKKWTLCVFVTFFPACY